jgi:hypothetical protein
VRRCLVVLVTALCCVAASAGPAQATNECRGLQVCVRVVGPWVVVPAQGSARGSVEFQLSCPRGFIVGGLDAELSDRAIDVSFVAKIRQSRHQYVARRRLRRDVYGCVAADRDVPAAHRLHSDVGRWRRTGSVQGDRRVPAGRADDPARSDASPPCECDAERCAGLRG